MEFVKIIYLGGINVKKLLSTTVMMFAVLLVFSTVFSSSASAASRISVTKGENELFVQSEKFYSNGDEVELDTYFIVPGNAQVYLMFEDIETEEEILMSQIIMRPGTSDITTHHRHPRAGYYYIQIRGDYGTMASARLKRAF